MPRIGKVSESVLKRSVLKLIKPRREDVIIKAGVGEDCGAIRINGDEIVLHSTQSIVADDNRGVKGAIISAANDIFISNGELIGITLAVTLPTQIDESELKKIMREAEETCEQLGAQILGGHTELTEAVNKPIISITAIGKTKDISVAKSKAHPGDDIIVTKWVALEGTGILARNYYDELRNSFSEVFIDAAKDLYQFILTDKDADVAFKNSISSIHNASNGGIFAALWEMAERSKVGLEIDLRAIPIRQETVEITEELGVNPYELLSGGALVITSKDGQGLARAFDKEGINAVIIGKVTAGNDRVILNGDEKRFLEPPHQDQIYNMNLRSTNSQGKE